MEGKIEKAEEMNKGMTLMKDEITDSKDREQRSDMYTVLQRKYEILGA